MSCGHCDRRTDAFLCKECGVILLNDLLRIPFLDYQVKVTARGGSKLGEPDGAGFRKAKKEIPLPPYRRDADDLAYETRQSITAWATTIAAAAGIDLRGRHHEPTCPACHHDSCATIRAARTWSTPTLSRFLATQLHTLRYHPDAAAAYVAITDIAERMEKKINRPEPMWYAGPCDECHRDLYVRSGAKTAVCQTLGCGCRYDVQDRRDALLSGIEDRLATATTIARALTSLGEPLSEDRIYLWKSKGQLVPHGWDTPVLSYDAAGRRRTRQVAMFRIGEVRALMAEAQAAKDRRKSKDRKRVAA